MQAMKNVRLTSGQMVGRLFKKPSKLAQKQGEARLMLEDMVRRAERKLAEAERKSRVGVQSAEARAEELAKELFHKPGSMLSEKEIALMIQESGCQQIRKTPLCCNPYVWYIRTIDGTCNNLKEPLLGASGTAFTRIINAEYADGVDTLRGGLQARQSELFNIGPFVPPIPSARLISKTISYRNETAEEKPFTHVLMQWGQFLDHDMDLSPELEPIPPCESCEFTKMCEPIFVARDDPDFGEGTLQNGDCLRFARSLPVCDMGGKELPAREQLNDITSFIDASQVYGSNEIVGKAVRKFENGFLLEGERFPQNKPALPIDNEDLVACANAHDCFLAGDARANEQISLTIMHTLWFREHNRIARELKVINPFWNDEILFQEARKIVGALVQKITYDDYLPKVLGQTTFDAVIGPYPGYDRCVNPGVSNAFATAAYRYGHSLVRPEFSRLNKDLMPIGKGPLSLVDAFFNPAQFKMSMGTDPIARGWVTDLSLRFDAFLTSILTTKLFAGENRAGMDLASLDIQRGRDHGLPPFLTWVNHCRLRFPNLTVSGEFESDLNLVRFLELYGSLDDVDLWIGGLAEKRLPDAFFGSVFACIFGITFSNVRNGDRFWYEKPGVFTQAQLAEIKKGTLSRVICDNSDNIQEIQPDAFLGNQTRRSCLDLPSVDLEKWYDDGCFVHVQVMPTNSPVLISTFSRVEKESRISYFPQILEVSQVNLFQCMAVACPSDTVESDTFILLYSNKTRVQMVPNSDLPINHRQGNHRYFSVWPKAVFNQAKSGVFMSKQSCLDSEDVAFTISMKADMQQDGEGEDSLEADLAKLGEDGTTTPSTYQGNGGLSEMEETAKEMSDGDLVSQLEQALQDLAL